MWRTVSAEDRDSFLNNVKSSLAHRQREGEVKYGNQFIGDPIQHAWEELLDALFYIWVVQRRHEEVIGGSSCE
mgnify:CR=1 FL=1